MSSRLGGFLAGLVLLMPGDLGLQGSKVTVMCLPKLKTSSALLMSFSIS